MVVARLSEACATKPMGCRSLPLYFEGLCESEVMEIPALIFICPVCGWDGLAEAPYDKHGCASFEICPCCGVEYGFDDYKVSFEELRRRWIADGMAWWSGHSDPPPRWDANAQLRRAGHKC